MNEASAAACFYTPFILKVRESTHLQTYFELIFLYILLNRERERAQFVTTSYPVFNHFGSWSVQCIQVKGFSLSKNHPLLGFF